MNRFYYSNSISNFINESSSQIVGELTNNHPFSLEQTQRNAWNLQIKYLKECLINFEGQILFEYAIPRMGKRIDVVLLIKNVIFVLEFKIGEQNFQQSALDQVLDYSLDLKNFHATSHNNLIAPILIAPEAEDRPPSINMTPHNDNLLFPIKTNINLLQIVINEVLKISTEEDINSSIWINGKYSPTPTIIEAALALFNEHSVEDISRNDASAKNLSITSNFVSELIEKAKLQNEKIICFVTGVPGAGKTLVGLDVATKHLNKSLGTTSVFLSGNGPLVDILRESLTRNKVATEKAKKNTIRKSDAARSVKAFIQNVHHFRDECLQNEDPPFDHVAIFDEAQRAWDLQQTTNFMKRKKGISDFLYSEPEFLISCLDRHKDWAVIVCLVGGGQEINTGEAGITEWIECLNRSYPLWNIYISPRLTDTEYTAGNALDILKARDRVLLKDELHLSISMRSFRAESLSLLVKNLLDLNLKKAREGYTLIKEKYPIVITRNLDTAKSWLMDKARGSERYGIIASSQALRLKPYAINVKSPMDPIHWFLGEKSDIRSSFYLEDIATEFHVQGLELDWTCVAWDGDLRFNQHDWETFSFSGTKWNKISKEENKKYLKNAYRVLLTRARQGMVIFIPLGDNNDNTRKHQFYDDTFNYLKEIGFEII